METNKTLKELNKENANLIEINRRLESRLKTVEQALSIYKREAIALDEENRELQDRLISVLKKEGEDNGET